MKSPIKETIQIIRSNIKNILLFELIYRLMTLPVFLKLVDSGMKFSLQMAGYSYLTVGNIGMFLLKPWTIVCIAVIGFVGLVILLVEAGALITAFQGAAYSRRAGIAEMFSGGVGKFLDECRKKNWRLLFVVFMQSFLMQLYLIYRMMERIKPVSFVTAGILCDPVGRALLIAGLLLFICISVPTIFIFHSCMIEQKSFRDGLWRSIGLPKKKWGQTILVLAFFNVAIILGMMAIYAVSVVITAVVTLLFTDSSLALAVLLHASGQIEMILAFITSIVILVTMVAAVTVMYYQYSSQLSREASWDFSFPKRAAKSRKMVVGVVFALCAVSVFYIYDMVRNGFAVASEVLAEVQITAHRGSSRNAPENTMSALEKAVEELADYAEIDVQETSDGVVVLMHDANMKRVSGVNKSVKSMTFEEIEKLDVGSWLSDEFAGEKIPSLEQVMEFCKGKINLNIEVKNVGKGSSLPEKVIEIIDAYDMKEQCVVTSTSLAYLTKIKELDADIRTGYIVSAAYGNYYSNDNIDFISIRSSFVNERLTEAAHEEGKAIHAWTVNSKSEMERLTLLGVDNIITDNPVLAREIVYRKQATESLFEYLRLVLK